MEAWREDLYLSHHGIKDMRWGFNKGQRNGKKTKSNKDEKSSSAKSEYDWWSNEYSRARKNFKSSPNTHNRIEYNTAKEKKRQAWKEYEKSLEEKNKSKNRFKKRIGSAKQKAKRFIDNLFSKK